MDRKYQVIDGKVKLTETKEISLSSRDIEGQIQYIQKEKIRLIEQNSKLVERYNGLLAEENKLRQMIAEVGPSVMEIIDPAGEQGV